jgi:hypothetical protein
MDFLSVSSQAEGRVLTEVDYIQERGLVVGDFLVKIVSWASRREITATKCRLFGEFFLLFE